LNGISYLGRLTNRQLTGGSQRYKISENMKNLILKKVCQGQMTTVKGQLTYMHENKHKKGKTIFGDTETETNNRIEK